jgi:hypothetical protein
VLQQWRNSPGEQARQRPPRDGVTGGRPLPPPLRACAGSRCSPVAARLVSGEGGQRGGDGASGTGVVASGEEDGRLRGCLACTRADSRSGEMSNGPNFHGLRRILKTFWAKFQGSPGPACWARHCRRSRTQAGRSQDGEPCWAGPRYQTRT